jgi:hypothetical protein
MAYRLGVDVGGTFTDLFLGGGWKDRLDRPVEAVARDVSFGRARLRWAPLENAESAMARARAAADGGAAVPSG